MRFTVIGDGAMGTASALLLARGQEQQVTIWCQFEENWQVMQQRRENVEFLPGVSIPESIQITADFSRARETDVLVVAVPMVYLAETLGRLADSWPQGPPIVSVVKGIEQETFRTPSQVINHVLGERPVVALSGPCHAEEIARELPASVVAASGNLQLAKSAQTWFTTDRFRVYTTHDLRGTELGGALKNVIAIAAGICDGLGLGDNAKSALLTRGLVEMVRFGVSQGAEAETFHGLAGLGDLITTCFSSHSRNRRVGHKLGEGKSLQEILEGTAQVAEGIWTARSVHDLALESDIDLPVTRQVHDILFENKSPLEALGALMSRDSKAER